MLSSTLLPILALATTFTLTTTATPIAAAAATPAASAANSKTCPNLLYALPQCCVPRKEGDLAEPDCITPAAAATKGYLKASCSYGDRTEASCCSDPKTGIAVLCVPV